MSINNKDGVRTDSDQTLLPGREQPLITGRVEKRLLALFHQDYFD